MHAQFAGSTSRRVTNIRQQAHRKRQWEHARTNRGGTSNNEGSQARTNGHSHNDDYDDEDDRDGDGDDNEDNGDDQDDEEDEDDSDDKNERVGMSTSRWGRASG